MLSDLILDLTAYSNSSGYIILDLYETIKSCASYYGYKSFCSLSGYLKHPETMPKIWKERGLVYYDTKK